MSDSLLNATPDKPIFIYCLWCPVARRIRYIGKSNNPPERTYLHMFAAARGYYKTYNSRWLRKLLRLGREPKLRVLMQVPAGDDWQHHERELIARALKKGWPLTNQTVGGDGVVFLSEDAFEAAKAARCAGYTEEVRARMSNSAKLAWADPQKRKRIVAKQSAAAQSPERRAALSVAAHSRTAEGEVRRLAAVAAYWKKPENIRWHSERMKLRMANPEVGRAMSRRAAEVRRLKQTS